MKKIRDRLGKYQQQKQQPRRDVREGQTESISSVKNLHGKACLNLGDLAAWCLDRPVPDLLDEPFVVDYRIFFGDEEEVADDQEPGDIFRFFISTRRILNFSLNAKVILHTDATYKVNWNSYPLLVVGTSDLNRRF